MGALTDIERERQTASQAVEAMRGAVLALLAGADTVRRNGHPEKADAYDTIAARVRAIDLETVITAATGLEAPTYELAAFEEAARAASFNVARGAGGEYLHPITQRVRAIWTAALSWSNTPPPHVCTKCHCSKGDAS